MDVLATVQAAVSGTSTDATAEGVSGILVRKPSEAVGVGAVAEKVVKNVSKHGKMRAVALGRISLKQNTHTHTHIHSCSIIYIHLKVVQQL